MFFKKMIEKANLQGWHDGFDVGRKKAVHETRKVYVKLLTDELNSQLLNKQPGAYLKGIERALEIIRKGKR
jgi:hypothetical protein